MLNKYFKNGCHGNLSLLAYPYLPWPPGFLSHCTLLGFGQLFALEEGVETRKRKMAGPIAGLDWLQLSWLFFQLQSTLCVINDTETCPWQPIGPLPVLCKYQPEAALVLCQARDGKSKSRKFLIFTGAHHTSTAVVSAPGTGWWILCNVPSENLRRKCHSFTSLCLCVCLGRELLCVPLSPLSSLWFKIFSPAGYFLFLEVQNISLVEG